VHATDKMLRELGDKVSGEERAKIESALAGVKDAIKSDNKSTIETKLKALEEASGSVAQRLYAQQGGAAGSAAGGGQGSGAAGGDDNVVDAEFEEVKDDKKGNT
jgi:molecular chaperone DnaK